MNNNKIYNQQYKKNYFAPVTRCNAESAENIFQLIRITALVLLLSPAIASAQNQDSTSLGQAIQQVHHPIYRFGCTRLDVTWQENGHNCSSTLPDADDGNTVTLHYQDEMLAGSASYDCIEGQWFAVSRTEQCRPIVHNMPYQVPSN